MERTIEIEIQLLLPGIKDEKDECLARLESALQNRKGILRAHLEREKSPVDICLHYDPNLLTITEVQGIAERAGARIVNRYHHDSIPIEGMDCSDCSLVLEHSIKRLQGVVTVNVNYPAEKMWVEYDNTVVNHGAIEKRIRSMGYAIPLSPAQRRLQENRKLIFSLLSGAFLFAGWLGGWILGFPAILNNGFYLAAYLSGGWDVSRNAWAALRERHFDIDLLMILAAVGAALLGEFVEGALLLFLFSLGHALEDRALNRARTAVRALSDLAPKTAVVQRSGEEQELPVESLELEDTVIVRPGVRIPVDGIIQAGNSGVNQSPVTGESLPVDKVPGDQVFAGSVNGEGVLEVRVTRLAKDSTLVRVMRIVEEAQAQKSPTQQTIEKFERYYVPVVLILTGLVIIVPPLLGFQFKDSFLRAMTVLVAASPCALALGTPASILAGVAQAARNGVLVKGGVHLENLGRLKAIAFDKTGTITHGQPEVTDIVAFQDVEEKSEVLALAAGAESRSAHPLAQAIVRAAQKRQVSLSTMSEVEAITGQGLRAISNGETIWVGNKKLLEAAGVVPTAKALENAEALEQAGKTVIWVARGNCGLGMLALADTMRREARQTMEALKEMGVANTIILTGDNARSASAIAGEASVSEYQADLMPGDKQTVIQQLVRKYGQVAMIGDGVNDAPALASATVGIAMGGAGTDVALETADVALMSDELSKLPFAVGLGRRTRGIILQNLAIAFSVIILLVAASLTGVINIGLAIVFHESSTLMVVVNALRLLGYKGS